MEEIYSKVKPIQSLHRTYTSFLQICKDESLIILLYQFIGYSGIIQLITTNRQTSKAINSHEQLQVYFLQLKVKKLKERQYKRLYPYTFRVDLQIFNPFILPPLDEEVLNGREDNEGQEDTEKINLAILESRKLNDYDLIRKNNWRKWKANKKVQNILGIRSKTKTLTYGPSLPIQNKQQISFQQKMRSIRQAEKIIQIDKQIQSKLLNGPRRINYEETEAIRNQHFVNRFIKNSPLNSTTNQHNQHTETYKKANSEKIQQYDQFFDAWSPNIKKKVAKKLWKTQRPSESNNLISIHTNALRKVSRNLGDLFQIPGFIKVIKQTVSIGLFSRNNSQ